MDETQKKLKMFPQLDRSKEYDTLSFEVDAFPDPKTYRTGTIPPECPLLDKEDENNQQNNPQSIQ